jgi:hypothetical protein
MTENIDAVRGQQLEISIIRRKPPVYDLYDFYAPVPEEESGWLLYAQFALISQDCDWL